MRIAIGLCVIAALIGVARADDGFCEGKKFCSKIFMAHGVCDGQDQVPILSEAWEKQAIRIKRVTIGLITHPPTKMAYTFAGNSCTPDVMNFMVGSGDKTEVFEGQYFDLPVRKGCHVDLHVQCNPYQELATRVDKGAHNFHGWLLIYYEKAPDGIDTASGQ